MALRTPFSQLFYCRQPAVGEGSASVRKNRQSTRLWLRSGFTWLRPVTFAVRQCHGAVSAWFARLLRRHPRGRSRPAVSGPTWSGGVVSAIPHLLSENAEEWKRYCRFLLQPMPFAYASSSSVSSRFFYVITSEQRQPSRNCASVGCIAQLLPAGRNWHRHKNVRLVRPAYQSRAPETSFPYISYTSASWSPICYEP